MYRQRTPDTGIAAGFGPLAKVQVIPDDVSRTNVHETKGPLVWERPISYQLVGEVMAHQGNDAYRD